MKTETAVLVLSSLVEVEVTEESFIVRRAKPDRGLLFAEADLLRDITPEQASCRCVDRTHEP